MASCLALLKRGISSMKRMVRRRARRGTLAPGTTFLRSATPAVTADIATMRALVSLARRPARVVLPLPGGPHRTMLAMCPGLVSCRKTSTTRRWPTSWSNVFGRIRVARGAWGSEPGGIGKSSPWSVISQILNWERFEDLNRTIRPHGFLLVLQLRAVGDRPVLPELRPQPDGPHLEPPVRSCRSDHRHLELEVPQRVDRSGGQPRGSLPPAPLGARGRARSR